MLLGRALAIEEFGAFSAFPTPRKKLSGTKKQEYNEKICIHCGQLILRKISKIGPNRCKILKVKCTKFDCCWGSAPDPTGGAYSTHQDPVAVLQWEAGQKGACAPGGTFHRVEFQGR